MWFCELCSSDCGTHYLVASRVLFHQKYQDLSV